VYSATTVDEWTAVLNLAAMWKFESTKAFSIERLANLASPIDKIVLGRKHNVVEWLSGAYREVCERDGALTLEEAHRLGMEDVVRISSLRQDIRGSMAFGSGLLLSVDSIHKRFELEGNNPLVSSSECNGKAETESCVSTGSPQVSEQCVPTSQKSSAEAGEPTEDEDEDYGIKPTEKVSPVFRWGGRFAQVSEAAPIATSFSGGDVLEIKDEDYGIKPTAKVSPVVRWGGPFAQAASIATSFSGGDLLEYKDEDYGIEPTAKVSPVAPWRPRSGKGKVGRR
jgi:hypothetical protein